MSFLKVYFWNTDSCHCCLLCSSPLASLAQICLPCCSQADRDAVLPKISQWLPVIHRTKSRICSQHAKSLKIWTLCHLPPSLALPWPPSSTKQLMVPRTRHSVFCFCPSGFLCHAPPSVLDLQLIHSSGAALFLEHSLEPLSYYISIVSK